uniref:Transposase n=1 Tax=Acrobeloides nanus TaxID=290746 RepID=A0A914CCC3_9BILA
MKKLQKFAARLVTNDYNSSYSQLLPKLKWTPISQLATVRRVAKDIWTKLPAEAISQSLVLFKHSMKTPQMYELLSKKVLAVRRMEEAI